MLLLLLMLLEEGWVGVGGVVLRMLLASEGGSDRAGFRLLNQFLRGTFGEE